MNELAQLIARAWTERTLREQALLAAMTLVLVLVAGWYLALSPMLDFHASARTNYADAMGRYRTLEAGIADYRARIAGAETRGADDRPLRTIAGATALARDIQITRILPDEDGRLNVWIDQAPTRELMAWLMQLESRHGVGVARISLDRESDDFVAAQIVLVRAGGGA